MSWHFSRALVEAYSVGTCSGGDASAQSSSTTTQDGSSWLGKTTDACRLSRYGTTLELLTVDHGEELLTSYLAGFHVKTSAAQEKELDSTVNVRDSGWKWRESFAKYSHASRSWKIRQCSLLEGLDAFSETWPRWGMMRDGELCPLKTPVLHTDENGSGYLPTPVKYDATPGGPNNHYHGLGHMAKTGTFPTPRKSDGKGATSQQAKAKAKAKARGFTPNLPEEIASQQADGGQLNPMWVEWLMGWPIGWTDLQELEMDKFRQWLESHGRH